MAHHQRRTRQRRISLFKHTVALPVNKKPSHRFQFFKKFQAYGLWQPVWQGSVVHYSTDASRADKPLCGRFQDGTEEWYDMNQLRVLPGPCPATRNLSFVRFHRRRHPVVSTRCFTRLVRVGVKIPQDGNRANVYEHVAMVPGHVWRTVCSVCATGARVAQPVPCNS
jgi:hypothetical protein